MKGSGTASEEQVLIKSFKYFDLNDNGAVEPDEFAKAIEKIGIMIPTKQVSSRKCTVSERLLFPHNFLFFLFNIIKNDNDFKFIW